MGEDEEQGSVGGGKGSWKGWAWAYTDKDSAIDWGARANCFEKVLISVEFRAMSQVKLIGDTDDLA